MQFLCYYFESKQPGVNKQFPPYSNSSFVFFCFFFCVSGDLPTGLTHATQVLYHRPISPGINYLFFLFYFCFAIPGIEHTRQISNTLEYYTYRKIPKWKVQRSCQVVHLKEGPLIMDLWDWVHAIALWLTSHLLVGKGGNVIWEQQALHLDSLDLSQDWQVQRLTQPLNK